jgi:plastocyanin
MKLLPGLGVAIVLLALALHASPSVAGAADMATVIIVDDPRPPSKWGYAPGTRRIEPGTWVTWSNDGYDAHSVTATDGLFDSGELNPSEGFSFYFTQVGTFAYVCSLHPWMTGKIIVGEQSAVSSQPSAGDGSSVSEEVPAGPADNEITPPAAPSTDG